jgi:hypothetical protein
LFSQHEHLLKSLEIDTGFHRVPVPKSDLKGGQLNPGQLNPGQFNHGQLNPGQFNLGQLNPGQFNLGQHNPGQYNPVYRGKFNPRLLNSDLQPSTYGQLNLWSIQPWTIQPMDNSTQENSNSNHNLKAHFTIHKPYCSLF